MDKWDSRFMVMAKEVSAWSKDPSTKIGAITVGANRRILSTGYNGFPRGISDDERLEVREQKYELIVHAEMNTIYNATYNGVSLDGATLYVYGLPVCSDCAKGIIQVGIKRVVMRANLIKQSKWTDSFKLTRKMFNESGVDFDFIHI